MQLDALNLRPKFWVDWPTGSKWTQHPGLGPRDRVNAKSEYLSMAPKMNLVLPPFVALC